jgi:hypothetical protein
LIRPELIQRSTIAAALQRLIHRTRNKGSHLVARHIGSGAIDGRRHAVGQAEKYASAIEQKNMLAAATSLKGNVVDPFPQGAVSALNWVDAAVMIATNATNAMTR